MKTFSGLSELPAFTYGTKVANAMTVIHMLYRMPFIPLKVAAVLMTLTSLLETDKFKAMLDDGTFELQYLQISSRIVPCIKHGRIHKMFLNFHSNTGNQSSLFVPRGILFNVFF